MMKIKRLMFIALSMAMAVMCSLFFVSCDDPAEDIGEHDHIYGEWVVVTEPTCGEAGLEKRTCSVCKEEETREISATGEHTYGDWAVETQPTCGEAGLEKRTCEVCGTEETREIAATGEHTYGDWTVIRDAECEEDGLRRRVCSVCDNEDDEAIPATGHSYADEFTCHDRQCLNCDHVEKATTAHKYGEWEVVSEPTCLVDGQDKRTCEDCGAVDTKATKTDHVFNENGECKFCGKHYKELLFTAVNNETITVNKGSGAYVLSNTETNGYMKMNGSILKALKEMGYTELTMTFVNPAPGLADMSNKCKSLFIAAESTSNLWSEDTAIGYFGWQKFWNDGKKETVVFDLATYAGKDIYVFADHVDDYPLSVSVAEFYEITDPSNWLLDGSNGKVTYIEGKGWVVASVNGDAFYAVMPAEVVKHFVAEGYIGLRVTFANSFQMEEYKNTGNFVNTDTRILVEKAGGGNDWAYAPKNFISQYATLNAETGEYYFDVSFEDETHDFTKEIEFYFPKTDVSGTAATPFAYISGLKFLAPHTYGEWTVEKQADCGNDGLKVRTCTDCGKAQTEVIPATGEHTYGEWETVTEAVCGTAGLKKQVCTVCGKEVTEEIAATGVHSFGEWETVNEASCNAHGTMKRTCANCDEFEETFINRTDAHVFGDDGKCTLCGEHYSDLLAVAVGRDEYKPGTVNKVETNVFEFTNTENRGIVRIPGSVLAYLKTLGYESIKVNAYYNVFDSSNQKNIYIYSTLENSETEGVYIYYKSGKNFAKLLNTYTMTVDLDAYAETGLYVQMNKCDVYPSYVRIILDDYDRSTWLTSGSNGTARYFDGKGWVVIAADATKAYNAAIPASVIQHYVEQGCVTMRIRYINNIGIEAFPNEGAFINSDQRIMPKKTADGGDDWAYAPKTYISQFATADTATNTWYYDVDLTDTTHDFTKDVRMYFSFKDINGKATPYGYIKDIEFISDPYGKPMYLKDGTNGDATYVAGKGWVISAVDTTTAYNAYISADIIKHNVELGKKTMRVRFINSFGLEAYTNEGAFINSDARIMPTKAAGGDDWTLAGDKTGAISKYATLDETTNTWYYDVDLTDETHNYTKDVRLYFSKADVNLKATPNAFIADIEFLD